MKKIIQFILIILISSINLSAQNSNEFGITNSSINRYNVKNSELTTSPWTSGVGYKFNMSVFAQVNLNDILFKPTGLVLAVFKDGQCQGQATISNSPATGGKGFVLTVGSNNTPEAGLTYKVFDPTTSIIYDVLEALTFQSMGKEGTINSPTQLHITGISALKETYETLFTVCPNIVKNNFSIIIGNEASELSIINLYNVSGELIKVIYKGETHNNQIITSSIDDNLAKGMYFIKASFGQINCLKKIIVK